MILQIQVIINFLAIGDLINVWSKINTPKHKQMQVTKIKIQSNILIQSFFLHIFNIQTITPYAHLQYLTEQ